MDRGAPAVLPTRAPFGMTLRRRGALGAARQGRRPRSYPEDTGAAEDAASRRPARSGGTRLRFERSSQPPEGGCDPPRPAMGVEPAPGSITRIAPVICRRETTVLTPLSDITDSMSGFAACRRTSLI